MTGAAISVLLSRLIFVAVGYRGAVVKHDLVARPSLAALATDLGPLARIALPAMLTNLATPAANAVLARVMASFGVGAVAASGVIDRVVPLAFGGVFALSGAIGPVLGQNWGARLFPRMHRVLDDALLCTLAYVTAMWLVLAFARELVVWAFRTQRGGGRYHPLLLPCERARLGRHRLAVLRQFRLQQSRLSASRDRHELGARNLRHLALRLARSLLRRTQGCDRRDARGGRDRRHRRDVHGPCGGQRARATRLLNGRLRRRPQNRAPTAAPKTEPDQAP